MDKIVPIIYMVGVFLLILTAFMSSNNNGGLIDEQLWPGLNFI